LIPLEPATVALHPCSKFIAGHTPCSHTGMVCVCLCALVCAIFACVLVWGCMCARMRPGQAGIPCCLSAQRLHRPPLSAHHAQDKCLMRKLSCVRVWCAGVSLSLSLSLSSLSSLSPSLALSRPLSPSLALSLPAGAPAPLVWARAVSASGRALRVTCAAASAAPSALSSVRANLFALPANCSSDGIAPAAPLALLTPTHVPLHVASSIVPRQKKSVSRQEGMVPAAPWDAGS
jgi:hypothetical protein